MTKKNLSIVIVLIGFLFLGCSTQPPETVLNAPLGLSATTTATSIVVTFYGFNGYNLTGGAFGSAIEKNFSGYNLYTSLAADPYCVSTTPWVSMNALGSGNAVSSNQSTRILPTLTPDKTVGVTVAVTKVTATLLWDHTATSIDTSAGTGKDYCIGVKAIDLNDNITSKMSNTLFCNHLTGSCVDLP